MNDLYAELINQAKAMWRFRWLSLGIAWVVAVLGWGTVIILPDEYESEARIYVDTGTLLGPLLRGLTIESNADREVAIMQRTLLSRPNLEQVVRMNDLDLTVNGQAETEALLARLADKLGVRAETNNLFTITYSNRDPRLSQSVVQSALTIFVENNLGQSRTDMESARGFIEKQIAEYERQLRVSERKTAEFRAANAFMLSASGSFSAKLSNLSTELSSIEFALRDAEIRRDELKRQLEQIPERVQTDDALLIIAGSQGANTLAGRIAEAERSLDSLLLQYTEKHPDVVATERLIARLRERYAESNDGIDGIGQNNPLYENVKIMVVEAETTVAAIRRQLADAQAALEEMRSYAADAPKVEAEFLDLARDYEIIKGNYETLLARREAARISQAQDAEASNVQFRIIDPPSLPVLPSSPNRGILYIVVLFVSIGAGGGLAFVLTSIDESFVSGDQLARSLGLPVLGRISRIESAEEERERRKGHLRYMLAAGSLVASYAIIAVIGPYLVSIVSSLGGDGVSSIMGGAI